MSVLGADGVASASRSPAAGSNRNRTHLQEGPGPGSLCAGQAEAARRHATRAPVHRRRCWHRLLTGASATYAVGTSSNAAQADMMDMSGGWAASVQPAALAASLGQAPDAILRLLSRHPAPPGVSAAQLSSAALGISARLMLDPMRALSMVLRKPELLQQSPEEVGAAVAAIARLAGMEVRDAAPLVAAQPCLLDMPPADLRGDLSRLAASLEITQPALLLILSRCTEPAMQQLLGSTLPAVREQLSELRAVLDGQLGAGRANGTVSCCQLLVTCCPYLLLTPAPQVEASLAMLTRLLQLRSRRMLAMLSRCPMLLCTPASRILDNYRGALTVLRINQGAVNDMVESEPRLLQLDPAKMRQRMDGLLFGLYLPRKQVLDMLVRQPQLLLYYPATLSAHMAGLMETLALQHEVVVAMLQQYPNLLMFTQQLLKSKLALLTDLFLLPPMHACELVTLQPRLLSFSADRLVRSREVLTTTLGLAEKNMAATVFTFPDLLLVPPATVQGKARDLAAILSLDEEQAGVILSTNATFLMQNARLWQSNFDSLTSELGLSLEQVRSAVLAKPQLLSQNPKWLLERCRKVASLVNARVFGPRPAPDPRRPDWRTTLDSATGLPLARLLLCEPLVLQHLEFLVERGWQARQGLMATELYSALAFQRKHAGFEAWRAAKQQQQQSVVESLDQDGMAGGQQDSYRPDIMTSSPGGRTAGYGGALRATPGRARLFDGPISVVDEFGSELGQDGTWSSVANGNLVGSDEFITARPGGSEDQGSGAEAAGRGPAVGEEDSPTGPSPTLGRSGGRNRRPKAGGAQPG